ncbi:2-hydroxyacid dehydrogenase [Rathayibacter sp. VKM Ac-2856]|uniref:2-hydroxyacid dehydrogenase n=1 Tax=unclassified Rathayibacter TaxID=2609250 RepID=UPI001565325E|nr:MULTISPECIES: 2-hydroxyacid dehydrogenase [unclassified Rathayibacter]NQX06042.1 2-hydroxyacid dehydrogenase [Rathayibacter sp. VKM Ac-2858]NQX21008.1 2-hydroxyacid dehydrogenase [Rathayibacter sp. VKM Ac-2856]
MTRSPLTISVPSTALLDALQPADGSYELDLWDLTGPPPREAYDLVVLPHQGDPALLDALTAVACRLVQAQTIGTEGVLAAVPPGALLANASSVHESSTAELAVGLAIASLRRIDEYVRAASAGTWEQVPGESLADRTVAIIGSGGVGRAIERRLAGFEVDVLRFARTAREDSERPVHPIAAFPSFAADVEVVFLAVPLDASTHHLVDDAFLSALPSGALLVNVSRGAVVDTDALVRHLESGRLRAALDVVDPEPLPRSHPLWSTPNTILTPHVGGASSAMTPRIIALLRRQIEALLRAEPPVNVVGRA